MDQMVLDLDLVLGSACLLIALFNCFVNALIYKQLLIEINQELLHVSNNLAVSLLVVNS